MVLGSAAPGQALGAVLAALRVALGLADGVVELSVNYNGAHLGIPLRFTDGTPTVHLPELDPVERRLLAAADVKIRTAYQTIQHHTEGAIAP